MRLIFHGTLRDILGPDAVMHVNSIREAVEGYSRQHPDWPSEMLIDIPGYDTVEAMEDCPEEIHLIPSMLGGGGKFGTILLGVAMVALAFTPVGALTVGLKAAMIISGGIMILQGVVGLFMKAPKLGKNQDPEASKYLPINKNTTAVDTPITMAWGHIDLAGHWLSLQSDSSNLSYGVFPANPT